MPTKRNQELLDLRHHSDKKASKPLMEKRRRARINHSLAQLKALVIDPNTSERSRQTKLEKADILELTVRHLHEIKRQQRTALLLESRHPKKKFEIGYSECAREVELFLTNLITPGNSDVDLELQKRLRDHLNKRLEDFRNIVPLDGNPKKESSEGDPSGDELSSSPSSSVSNVIEDIPLPVDAEETDSADSSALNAMLKCYADNDRTMETNNSSISYVKPPPKRLKKMHSSLIEEGLSFSCQSVTSTTGFKLSSDASVDFSKTEKYSDTVCSNAVSETCTAKNVFEPPYFEPPNLDNAQSDVWKKTGKAMKVKSVLSSYLQKSKSKIPDHASCSASVESNIENKNVQCSSSTNSRNQKFLEQIPLVPRQLANGDWALVLPASLVPTEKDESYPFSAFRLVVPANSPDLDPDHARQNFHSSSSPLSSTVSDMSVEEYYLRSDNDPVDRMDHSSPDSTQVVWRPW